MRRTTLFLTIAFMACCHCTAQLSIEECYRKARQNYPLVKQYGLIDKTEDYNLSNAAKGYLPQLAFTAQATYQSDVTKLPFGPEITRLTGLEIPILSKDQYKASVDINQTVWDGGAIASKKKAIRAKAETDRRQTDVGLYALNGRVNQLFFGILLVDAQTDQNRILQDELSRSCRRVESYIRNGVASQADLDAIRVDLVKAQQDEAQLKTTRRAYAQMLSLLTGEHIGDSTRLVRPVAGRPAATSVNNRPELALYDSQLGSLKAEDEGVTAGLMPRLSLFATGGYGKPGFDMLEDKFVLYGMAGVRLQWNIGSLYTRKNDRRRIATGMEQVENSRKTFLFDVSMEATQRNAAIDRLTEQLKYDDEIIRLRGSVRRTTEAKLAGGTATGTDLARDIDAEQSAVKARITHEIELLEAIYNLKYVTNN